MLGCSYMWEIVAVIFSGLSSFLKLHRFHRFNTRAQLSNRLVTADGNKLAYAVIASQFGISLSHRPHELLHKCYVATNISGHHKLSNKSMVLGLVGAFAMAGIRTHDLSLLSWALYPLDYSALPEEVVLSCLQRRFHVGKPYWSKVATISIGSYVGAPRPMRRRARRTERCPRRGEKYRRWRLFEKQKRVGFENKSRIFHLPYFDHNDKFLN